MERKSKMISITQIDRNYNMLLGTGKYYEEEIFTKFEDAFILEAGSAPCSGITIIHSQRSKVVPVGATNDVELGDVRILMYSPKRYVNYGTSQAFRQLFIQFKKYEGKNRSIIIKPPQFELYNQHKDVVSVSHATYKFKNSVLNKSVSADSDIWHAGTMFAVGYSETGLPKLKLIDSELHRFKKRTNYLWKIDETAITEQEVSTDGYEYCTYIASLKDLLLHMKDMRVGMPIDDSAISSSIIASEIPEDLLNLINSNEVKEKDSEPICIPTVFINVDELR